MMDTHEVSRHLFALLLLYFGFVVVVVGLASAHSLSSLSFQVYNHVDVTFRLISSFRLN